MKDKKARKDFTCLTRQMSKKGVKLRTWCKSKGLSDTDCFIIYDMSAGKIKGIRGRAKELRQLLEKEGFKVA
ncbi:hypothetical protein [Helicobacter apodemus]|uniref:Transcriptional regulator n=1 Tax=Helicobacter apodemus TaxID=135569 RepID=A0A2U8FBH2_9HELI|nr:hypothetical protein [Helicobacter apodemus]AWI33559.1 hypothetical protein CDV25_01380 [Helicobacter apodemus]